jgi:hypothetical protein
VNVLTISDLEQTNGREDPVCQCVVVSGEAKVERAQVKGREQTWPICGMGYKCCIRTSRPSKAFPMWSTCRSNWLHAIGGGTMEGLITAGFGVSTLAANTYNCTARISLPCEVSEDAVSPVNEIFNVVQDDDGFDMPLVNWKLHDCTSPCWLSLSSEN